MLRFKLSSCTEVVTSYFNEIIFKVIQLFQINTGSISDNQFCCVHLCLLEQTALLKSEKEGNWSNFETAFALTVYIDIHCFCGLIILSPPHARFRTCLGHKCSRSV